MRGRDKGDGTIWHNYGADVLRKKRISLYTILMHRFRLIRDSMPRTSVEALRM